MSAPIRGAVLFAALAVAGCATTPIASPEQVAAEEERLLAPYEQSRAVVCDVLSIEVSANFDNKVARPAVSRQIHDFSHAAEDGQDVYRWSSRGGIQSPLKFQIGNAQFAALQSATLRVRSSGYLGLAVTAAGQVTESEHGEALRDWSEIRVENGLFHRR